MITVNGCAIEVLRGGSGTPMLFLHGAGGASAWAPYMDALAERFSLIVPSHPGYGRSETPPWLDSLSDLAYFYLDFIDALGLTDFHLAGNSLGGWIAAEIAVRSSARIRSLTLAAPAGIHVKGVPKGDIFLWDDDARIRNTFYDQALAAERIAQKPTGPALEMALKNHFTTAKLAWHPRFYNPDLHKWLHRIKVPTMILWGDSDRIFPPPYAEAYHTLIPGSQLRMIAQCGHLPHQEKLEEFLAGVDAITNGGAS
jgi:pimeloyl-ACP methyl ester carboxylesterase